jgi:hypothetical protein
MRSLNNLSIQDDLPKSITGSHLFLPFLGTEASCIRSSNEPMWKAVSHRVIMLLDDLGNEENDDFQGEINYLKSLADTYNLKLDRESISNMEIRKFENSDNLINQCLHILRLCLVQVGAGLVKLFGEQMITTRVCIDEISDYQVLISDRKDDIKNILKNLSNALDQLKQYSQFIPFDPANQYEDQIRPRLDTEAISARLLILSYHIGADFIESPNSDIKIYANHRDMIEHLVGLEVIKANETLHLDELAWLGDLLWYSLRYDIPAYMNSAELSFRLSLNAAFHELLRRRELLQVAELATLENHKVLTRLLKYCESEKGSPSEFHRSIAAALWLEYIHYKDWNGKIGQSDQGHEDLHLPLAICTNYDRSLEWACQGLKMPYHIVFPVTNKKGKYSSITWYFQTYTCEDDTYTKNPIEDCFKWELSEIQTRLAGPIIVKLHGSPAESLPSNPKEFTEIAHYIVLSESEYFGATVLSDRSSFKYPKWINNQLQAEGDWWFMGYSINDWFIRLRIIQHISLTEKHLDPSKPSVKVLDIDFDPFRTQIFHKLNIRRSQTALTQVQEIIKSMPEVKEILRKGIRQ